CAEPSQPSKVVASRDVRQKHNCSPSLFPIRIPATKQVSPLAQPSTQRRTRRRRLKSSSTIILILFCPSRSSTPCVTRKHRRLRSRDLTSFFSTTGQPSMLLHKKHASLVSHVRHWTIFLNSQYKKGATFCFQGFLNERAREFLA